MLFINRSLPSVQEISEAHFKSVRCMIWKRIGSSNTCSEKCVICENGLKKRSGVAVKCRNILENEETLRDLILAEPERMKRTSEKLFKELFGKYTYSDICGFRKKHEQYNIDKKKEKSKRKNLLPLDKDEESALKQFNTLSGIIDYSQWFNGLNAKLIYGPYGIAKALNMRSCIYCNRLYTITRTTDNSQSGKLMRPQFDHWYSKEKYPLLALSFYNLIPSCSTCNSSVKGRAEFNVKNRIHPYIDNIIDHFHFGFDYWNITNEYKVKLIVTHPDPEIKKKIEETLAAFKTDEVYDGHHPELDDLLLTAKAYSKNYLKSLKSAFPGAGLSDNDIYRFAFGTELNSADFHKRPMSKFKHDILKELGII